MATPEPTDDTTGVEIPPDRHLPPSWRDLHPGDDPAAEAVQFERWRTASPAAKMRQLAALNEMAWRLAMAGLRRRHPSAGPGELRRLLADMVLGSDLAASVYGDTDGEDGER